MILAFLSRYAVMALAAALALALVALGVQSYRLNALQASTANALADAVSDARTKESTWQATLSKVRDEKDAELRTVAAARDAALASVRNRRTRLPEAARAACQGATGRELSDRDAEVALRIAARADELRAELAACYRREDAIAGK